MFYLENYAKVLLDVGLGLRSNDGILLSFDEVGLPLARIVVREAYRRGAKDVITIFADDTMNLDRYNFGMDKIFDDMPKFKVDYREQAFLDNYHSLYITSPNPELLKDVDGDRVARWQKCVSQATEPIQHYQMDNKVKWCVASVPGPAWAKKVFPELEKSQALEALWNLIFEATRMKEEDPVEAWKRHDVLLKEKEKYLDDNNFDKILFKGPGTDLEITLVKGHKWIGGSSKLERGDVFMANIPTEEVFTMPHAKRVEGIVRATKPLSLQGQLVENFSIEFKEGKVVAFEAEKGREVLEKLFAMDEGAMRLGEVALVPDDSPISRRGVLFFNTLFDENASCHLALGNAYGENLRQAQELSDEEKKKLGMNTSMVHVDFMVGGPELEVLGIKEDGSQVVLLQDGNWV
ncbi:MAG: aminopeptidase [Tissierellia bacterium]|nr:aminopeptidase [Tissierellia bacterium]